MIGIIFNGYHERFAPNLRAMSVEDFKATVLPLLEGLYDVRETALAMRDGSSTVVLDPAFPVQTDRGWEQAGTVAWRRLAAAGLDTNIATEARY